MNLPKKFRLYPGVSPKLELFDICPTTAANEGYEPMADNFGYLLFCYVPKTDEKASVARVHERLLDDRLGVFLA